MARATFVKKARKDVPGTDIKKGDSYYWWKFMVGGRGGPKRYSKTPPRRSQLTQSDYLGQLYDIQDEIGELVADDTLRDAVQDIAQRLRDLGDEQREKYDNMPESLQCGDSGQLLEERADMCENAADELEGIDFDDFEEPGEFELPDADDGESVEDYEERCDEEQREHGEAADKAKAEWLEGKLEEVHGVSIDS